MQLHEIAIAFFDDTKASLWPRFAPEIVLCLTIMGMLLVRVARWGRLVPGFVMALAGSLVALKYAMPELDTDGNIVEIMNRLYNLNELNTSGFDIAMDWLFEMGDFGDLTWAANYTYIDEYTTTFLTNDGIQTDSYNNQLDYGIFANRGTTSLTWRKSSRSEPPPAGRLARRMTSFRQRASCPKVIRRFIKS